MGVCRDYRGYKEQRGVGMDMLNRGGYFRGYSGICVVDKGYEEYQGVVIDILNIGGGILGKDDRNTLYK